MRIRKFFATISERLNLKYIGISKKVWLDNLAIDPFPEYKTKNINLAESIQSISAALGHNTIKHLDLYFLVCYNNITNPNHNK